MRCSPQPASDRSHTLDRPNSFPTRHNLYRYNTLNMKRTVSENVIRSSHRHTRRRAFDKDHEEEAYKKLTEWGAKEAARCDGGDPDLELCDFPEVLESFPLIEKSVLDEVWSRGRWLLGLLVLQSTSSFILDSYQELIRQHLVVTLFLTMLVGAGGNAGNQSAIKVIRGLATGVIKPTNASMINVLKQQILVALLLGGGLSAAGWVRVWLTNGDAMNSTAIAISLLFIVVTSVLAGTVLPFMLARAGVDPANAGTSIQVIMDCLGVLITCTTCHFILDTLAQGVGVA